MVRLFVKPDKEILDIVKRGIEKCNGNLLKFSKEVDICRTTIYHWFEKKIWMDVKKFRRVCEYLKINHLSYIEGKKVHSTGSNPETFSNEWFKLNPNIALLLGWICTEGYIPKKGSCRVTIAQNSLSLLLKLKKIMKFEYPIRNKMIIISEKHKSTKKLEVSSIMFWYALVNHFGISKGKKNFIVCAPEQIFNSSHECKLAFLAASLEGDGSWPPSTLTIRMTSERYIKDCKRILSSIGFRSNAAPLSQKDTWLLQICARNDTAILINKFIPYLFHFRKFDNFVKKEFFRKVFYENMYIEFDGSKILEAKKGLKCTYSELATKLFKLSGYKVSDSYLKYLEKKGFKRGFANIRLPLLVVLAGILGDKTIISHEYRWILNALDTPSLKHIKEISS